MDIEYHCPRGSLILKGTTMSNPEPWYFEDAPDEVYERFLVPAKFGPWADDLVAQAKLQPGQRVLDVACGTGTVTRLIPPRVGPSGKVVGLDFNAGRIDVAKSLPKPSGVDIEWFEGDATSLPFEEQAFDVVFCQQGLQFFPDKETALSEMRRVLVPGGKLLLCVWRTVEHQPGGRAMADALERHVSSRAGEIRREPFTFGNGDVIAALVRDAGFRNVVLEERVKAVHFPSAEAFTKRYISARVPLPELVSAVSDEARASLVADVVTELARFENAAGLALPTAVNVVSAEA
jgi:ubiquinone/menaquinone biosynthesis C-methylase UbiE